MKTRISIPFMVLAILLIFSNCSPEDATLDNTEAALQYSKTILDNGSERQGSFSCNLAWEAPVAPLGTSGRVIHITYASSVPLTDINCIREQYFTLQCEELEMHWIQDSDPRKDAWKIVIECYDQNGGWGTGKSTLDEDIDTDPRTECTGGC